MKTRVKTGLAAIAVTAATLGGIAGLTHGTSAPRAAAPAAAVKAAPASQSVAAARTAAQAIAWYSSRNGSRAYEGYCEKAARLAWARRTHHASAIAHWKSSDGVRHTRGTPPKGAFVFWNISKYGHIGIADGKGGFWATDVHGKIGHATRVSYYSYMRAGDGVRTSMTSGPFLRDRQS